MRDMEFFLNFWHDSKTYYRIDFQSPFGWDFYSISGRCNGIWKTFMALRSVLFFLSLPVRSYHPPSNPIYIYIRQSKYYLWVWNMWNLCCRWCCRCLCIHRVTHIYIEMYLLCTNIGYTYAMLVVYRCTIRGVRHLAIVSYCRCIPNVV